jgi:hypothetical protein
MEEKNNNFYPEGYEGGSMKLPNGHNVGKLSCNMVVVNHSQLQQQVRGVNLPLFIDVESPHETHKVMNEKEIHFGIGGDLKLQSRFSDVCKDHIDVYLPFADIPALIDVLNGLIGRKPDLANSKKVLCTDCGNHLFCPDCKRYVWKGEST